MNIEPTDLNQRLADLTQNRIYADRHYVAAKASFWRLIGVGIIAFGVGATAGIILFGYSYIKGNSDNLGIFSSAFSKALSDIQLRAVAEGTVQIEPREIPLAKDQTVQLDSNAQMLLDPGATVLANGTMEIHPPSISNTPSALTRSESKIPNITNFTVFKGVPFESGRVMTGWKFLTSAQNYPTSQYCYYTESAETSGVDVIIDIAEDERMN
jgi:hypothetical protein